LQSFFLYKKLLATPDKLFISTATVSSLSILNWAAGHTLPAKKAYLYFHWLNLSDKKFARLQRLARQQPHVTILGPAATVINSFKQAGFNNAQVVPYPISVSTQSEVLPASFAGLLYAGAARQDKGFSRVVDLLEFLKKTASDIPFRLQSSSNHHGEYDAATLADLQRLEKINYPHLVKFSETLDQQEYGHLFVGVICLQLYDPELFADRISGVTLDALSAGSPIITTADSWIARMVQRFDAGMVVKSTEPTQVLAAINAVIADYPRYKKNANAAGVVLQQENSAEFLFKTLVA